MIFIYLILWFIKFFLPIIAIFAWFLRRKSFFSRNYCTFFAWFWSNHLIWSQIISLLLFIYLILWFIKFFSSNYCNFCLIFTKKIFFSRNDCTFIAWFGSNHVIWSQIISLLLSINLILWFIKFFSNYCNFCLIFTKKKFFFSKWLHFFCLISTESRDLKPDALPRQPVHNTVIDVYTATVLYKSNNTVL